MNTTTSLYSNQPEDKVNALEELNCLLPSRPETSSLTSCKATSSCSVYLRGGKHGLSISCSGVWVSNSGSKVLTSVVHRARSAMSRYEGSECFCVSVVEHNTLSWSGVVDSDKMMDAL